MSTPWPTARIGDLFELGAGKSVTPASRHGENQHPFLRTSNVFWGRIDLSEVDRMHFTPEELSSKRLRKGDLLVCEGGDIGRAAIWDGQIPECSFQNHLHRLRPKSPEVVTRFFMYALQAGFTLLGSYDGAGNKTTIPNLSRSRLADLEVPCPPNTDQHVIAGILSVAQRGFEVQEAILRTLEELKSSAMDRLFTTGLTRPGSSGPSADAAHQPWQLERLEDCCRVVSSSISYTDFAAMSHAPAATEAAVRAMGIKVSDMNLPGNQSFLRRANLEKRIRADVAERRLVPPDAVVFPKRGAAIATNKKRLTTAWTVLDPNLIAVVPGDRLDVMFLFYWFQKFDLRAITEPGPTPQLNKKNLVPLLIPVPNDMGEQRDIGQALSAIDRKIELHRRKRDRLEELFNKLLHDLISGVIRVDQTDITPAEVSAA